MKIFRKKIWLVSIAIALVVLMVSFVSVSAAGPRPKDGKMPPLITDPAEAVPFSHPDTITVDPESPAYRPGARKGPPGSRFDSSVQKPINVPGKSDEIPIAFTCAPGHRYFSAVITDINADLTAAMQKFDSSLSIPSGTYLYGPTLLGTNDSPLEIVTRYYWDGGSIHREIAVFDHMLSGDDRWVASTEAVSDYLDANDYYTAEVYYEDGYWYAFIYNVDDSDWETWYSRYGGYGPSANKYGWDTWEEWGFNESSWPDIISITGSKELVVLDNTLGLIYVEVSQGHEWKCTGFAPYSFSWVHDYYFWAVNMNY